MAPKPPPPVHMIDVSGASKTFGNVVAVSDVSFTLDAGVTALLGPNGAGKSTLFRMLCGLTTPTVGTVKVLGRDARNDTPVRGKIGLSPQQDALFDRLTAYEFVEIAARTHGVAILTALPPMRSALLTLTPSRIRQWGRSQRECASESNLPQRW